MTGMAAARGDLQNGSGQGFVASNPAIPTPVKWAATLHAFRKLEEILPLLDGLESTVFQSRHWLACWLDVFGKDPDIECFLLTVENDRQMVVLALPLVRRIKGGIRVIEFTDLGVSDYAAPLLRRDALAGLPEKDRLWALILDALPTADLLCLERLCPFVQDMPNPLHAHPWARRNRISGWRLPLPETWESCQASMSPKTRDNLAKTGRRFSKIPNSCIAAVANIEEGLSALGELERMQEDRIQEKGLAYFLNDSRCRTFYRRLVETGIESGRTLMARMQVEDETVAVNFAVQTGVETVYLRVANRFGEFAKLSLGNLVTEFLIREAHGRKSQVFDFGMGYYEYKRRFGATEAPLMDLVLPLSIRGWPHALLWHARYRLSRSTVLRKLTGRSLLNEPCSKPET